MRKAVKHRRPFDGLSRHFVEDLEPRMLLSTAALIKDINPGSASSTPVALSSVNGELWFLANDGVHGVQPWKSNGTTAGTTSVSTDTSINFPYETGILPFEAHALGSKTFLVGRDSSSTYRLYSSTGAGLTEVSSATGPLSIENSIGGPVPSAKAPVVFNNAIYVIASDGTNLGFWKTDGTVSGTVLASNNSAIGFAYTLIPTENYLFFDGGIGANSQVCSINTSNQVVQLTNFPGYTNLLLWSAVLNNKLYFLVDATAGVQLWQSDGTAAGTSLVKQLPATGQGAYGIVATNGKLYIGLVANYLTYLYTSDGTPSGTTLFDTLGGEADTSQMVGLNGNVFFPGPNSSNNSEAIWSSDGTAANTKSLELSSLQNGPFELTTVGNLLYFIATDAAHGTELWQTDGTAAGTQVIDINPGPASGASLSPTASEILEGGNTLYFTANNGTTGLELYQIDNQDSITGTSAKDTITLTQDADHLHIDWTLGTTHGQLAINDPSGLTINGNGGSDVITLLTTNGDPLPNIVHLNGTFTITGLAGSNPLANTNLEIGASTVYIAYANAASDPLAAVRGYLQNGYNNGLWTGTPTSSTGVITSTAAAANVNHTTAIGYADSAEGLVALPANTIELKYTLYGDTGLAGAVGFTDFMRMTQHYTQNSGATWSEGDFNYDGSVNVADFNLLKPNYGQSLPAPILTPIAVAPPSPVRPPRVVTAPPPPAVLTPSLDGNAAIISTPLVTTDLTKAKHQVGRKTAHAARR
jgi:ELWxxDGT repeat protein